MNKKRVGKSDPHSEDNYYYYYNYFNNELDDEECDTDLLFAQNNNNDEWNWNLDSNYIIDFDNDFDIELENRLFECDTIRLNAKNHVIIRFY